MPFPIDTKLVVAVSSSALFDMKEEGEVFTREGIVAYRRLQRERVNLPMSAGVAFPFVRRLLKLNDVFLDEQPIEVVVLSRNDPDTCRRAMRSIEHFELSITRGAFLNGSPPYPYIPAFNASLFISANKADVADALAQGHPAGLVSTSAIVDGSTDNCLRIAFDFDGVLADDESEAVYRTNHDVHEFNSHEVANKDRPHNPGPLKKLLDGIARLQRIEQAKVLEDKAYAPAIEIAIVTARGAPADERLATTLAAWNVTPDKTFLLGGMAKSRILGAFRPAIFFDDQLGHVEDASTVAPSVHVPFGISNQGESKRSAG